MATINGDDGNSGLQTFDIDCQDSIPVSIAFTDDARAIVSGERNSTNPGGKLLQYNLVPDSNERNVPKILESLDNIDRALVSKDGKWIVISTGTSVMVKHMITNQVVEVDEHAAGVPVHAIDLSPDSMAFATGSEDKTVRAFDIYTRKLLFQPIQHTNRIIGIKFSPNGAYLATAVFGRRIQVWDARSGRFLFQTSHEIYGPAVDAHLQSPTFIPIGWSTDSECVFTVSSGKVMTSFKTPPSFYRAQDPAAVVQLPVPTSDSTLLYSFATNGRIIAYGADRLLSFWDTLTSSKIGPTITFRDSIVSLALSADDSFLACGRGDKKITVYLLREILPLHVIVDPASLPFINMSHAVFQWWLITYNYSMLRNALNEEIHLSYYSNKALISLKGEDWRSAVASTRQSLAGQPSIIDHIILARALVGQGQQESALEAFDDVFHTCGIDENRFLLLIKAILLFLSGKRENAVTRVKGLIVISDDSEKYNCLQILGNMYLLQGDWEQAFKSFGRARELSFYRRGHHLTTILLIFGPSFEERDIRLRHPWKEAVVA